MINNKSWDKHYTRDKSILIYPDENLVRMLKPYIEAKNKTQLRALDLGCGTGRHIKLSMELGVADVLGIDTSHNALKISGSMYSIPVIEGNATNIPVKDRSCDIVISWGSLHYTTKENLPVMIKEIYRILKKGGRLFGTLRTQRDTCLKSGIQAGNNTWITDSKDIENSVVSFYNEKELAGMLEKFSSSSYGLMERSAIGNLEKIISHYFFWAEK